MEKDKQAKRDTQKPKKPKVVYVSPEEAPTLGHFFELVKKRAGGIVKVTVTRSP
jgi:hypothetical protein